ncbi:hypothetical protein [Leptospira noguchii]|uniref:Uncharacterized protein n=2 Tax=Leptospira noguchii TaxID=28182 RepID=M6YIL6_9LEPT|nr:hypothetical protein [Leptospira noguchii]EMO89454.1 hypothetical protein LEP1GSC024_1515 [Leptospira noguchii str. 2001034031]UOG29409.1 hypothetical protein MAL06_11990 [Leptospira noguchii]UOG35249.1 hypothetical protein MAL02_05985 [Leptospira noguchii]UOG40519.1 hypothetical protein MAL05_11540 [Leptospira noguchii]UOG46164.1 hypothetical protein MAL01_06130 [Leptospira noguchii]
MWELLLLENSFSFSYAEPALHIHFWIKDFLLLLCISHTQGISSGKNRS